MKQRYSCVQQRHSAVGLCCYLYGRWWPHEKMGTGRLGHASSSHGVASAGPMQPNPARSKELEL